MLIVIASLTSSKNRRKEVGEALKQLPEHIQTGIQRLRIFAAVFFVSLFGYIFYLL